MRISIKKAFIFVLAPFLFASCSATPQPKSPTLPLESVPAPAPYPLPKQDDFNELVPAPVKGELWPLDDVDVSQVNKKKNHIAFTFDDAPGKTLERIVSVFLNYNQENPNCPAFASVFCNGSYAGENSITALRAAFTAGFEMASHTYSHKDLTKISDEELLWEIEENDRFLKRIDGKDYHLLRAPYGKLDERVKAFAKTPIIDWFIDTLDWTEPGEDAVYEQVFSQKSDGAIVLMHDGNESTVNALKRLLPDLKAAGFQVLSVSQMAKIHDCPLRVGGVYTRARKKTG